MINVLILQMRERDDVARHEIQSIAVRANLPETRIISHNLDISPTPPEIGDIDAVMIGGSGLYSVTKDYPFSRPLEAFVKQLYQKELPLFGICWGHQFIAQALGGEVNRDLTTAEGGLQHIHLCDEDHQLISGIKPHFPAYTGHQDCVTKLPPDAVELGFSDTCRNQIYAFKNHPIFGTQFHPELCTLRFAERMKIYGDTYLDDNGKLEARGETITPTRDAAQLLQNFIVLAYQHALRREKIHSTAA